MIIRKLITILLILAFQPLFAQKDVKVVPRQMYRLNIGDTLQLSIYGQSNSVRDLQVDPYGNITYLYVGTVKAYGKTIPELTKILNDKIKNDVKFSVLTVSPVKFGGRYFFIAGRVNKPGRKPLRSGMKLLSALAAGGGMDLQTLGSVTVDQADLQHAFLMRNGKNMRIDFVGLVEQGDMAQNILLKSGDYIYVPDAVNKQVYVLGEVNRQRSLDLKRPLTVMQAMAHVRGVTDDASDDILILRGSMSKPAVKIVSYKALVTGKRKDFFLKADDIIYVPERASLFGEELIDLALRVFVARIASESGSEAFRGINPDATESDNSFDFDVSP